MPHKWEPERSSDIALGEKLDGAKLVRYNQELEVTFAWYGGHRFSGYLEDGTEVCHWNMSEEVVSEDVATEELELVTSIDDWFDLPGIL